MELVVKLNVGGRIFTTERSTLLSPNPAEPNFFDGLLSDSLMICRVVDGGLWVDRDGDLFEHILRWLRDKKHKRRTLLPVNELQLLRSEADFYLLTDLVQDIDKRLADAKSKRTLIGATLLVCSALGAAYYWSRKTPAAAEQPPVHDIERFPMPQISSDDLAMCLLDEFSIMKAQSLS